MSYSKKFICTLTFNEEIALFCISNSKYKTTLKNDNLIFFAYFLED